MKALSFRQPWAELILQGRKTIDLRTWPTNYRGRLVIHASKKIERDICELYGLTPAALTTGALVGTVEIIDMVTLDEHSWEALREQHLKPGRFPGDLLGWQLAGPQRLAEPVPFRGRLGLFNIDDALVGEQAGARGQEPETGEQETSDREQRAAESDQLAFEFSPSQPPSYPIVNRQSKIESQFDPTRPFELHVVPGRAGRYSLSLFQWPIFANGHGTEISPQRPQRLVNLSGNQLRAVADHILTALRQNGYKPTDLSATRRRPFLLNEETGLRLALLFLAIKPLSRLDRIEAISSGLRVMPSEEAYYWFSKCTAESSAANAQRALRILLAGE